MTNDSLLYLLQGLMVFGLFFFIVSIALWLLGAYGLYKLGANSGIEYSWLAFIPIGNFYVLGKLTKEMDLGGNQISNLGMIFPVSFIASIILGMIPAIGFLFTLAFIVFNLIVHYNLYKKIDESKATLWTILTFLSIPYPFILFSLRNKTISI